MLHRLAGPFRTGIRLLEGREKRSGQEFVAAYAGLERHMNYFLELAFQPGASAGPMLREWSPLAGERARKEDPRCSLLVFEDRGQAAAPPAALKSPLWLKLELPVDEKELPTRMRDRRRDMARKNRKYSYESFVTDDPAHFDDFYHNMYVPHVQGRHDDEAYVEEYAALRREFDKGRLTVLMHEGKAVAAGLMRIEGKRAVFRCHGVRGGSKELIRMGATDVLMYHEFEMLKKLGIGTADLGHCRSFFSDGVFRYKTELGARPSGLHGGSGDLRFVFLRRTPALESFLRENPFVVRGSDAFGAAVFVDAVLEGQALDAFLHERYCRGFERITAYTLDGSTRPPVESTYGSVEFVPAATVLGKR